MTIAGVLLLDRGFVNYANFARVNALGGNRHWLCRAKSRIRYRVVAVLAEGDALVELKLSPQSRKADPTLPRKIVVRMIQYALPGKGEYRLLTSLTNAKTFPFDELTALYHQRWEIEMAYDEIKVKMLRRRETIRSKTPEGVRQEIWGIAVAYNLVRILMVRAARKASVPPRRMSFHNSLLHVRTFLLTASIVAPSKIPRLYAELCHDLTLLLLPERRDRSYPRAVKLKMSNYRRKHPA